VNAVNWLGPVRSLLPALTAADWAQLDRLDALLGRVTASGGGLGARGEQLLAVRRDLAADGYAMMSVPSRVGGSGRPAVLQALAQFVCGWHDLDLRDATGPGHGTLVLKALDPDVRSRWLRLLAVGELIGVAATERHGGSRIQEITTRATLGSRGGWLISGEKTWISRLAEAAGLVVFFRDPDGQIGAAIIDASTSGLERELITPAGLSGWSWGVLRMHQVAIDPCADLIGTSGAGLDVFREHFARFRPLVAATALGAAARVHTEVTQTLSAKVRVGVLPKVRDNALVSIGRTYGELTEALLFALAATALGDVGDPAGDLWARAGKAGAVDTALSVTDELVPFTGAAGFAAVSPLVKIRADLAALRYADGIHDSLYRSAGKSLLAGTPSPAPSPAVPLPRSAELATA
jgi:alkylation response protein AidB-like acyl-CoA dehydrogenase